MRQRRKFTREFKVEAVRLSQQPRRSVGEVAIARELPDAGLVAHSDRGVQYASEHYQSVLTQHDLECSMSRRGN